MPLLFAISSGTLYSISAFENKNQGIHPFYDSTDILTLPVTAELLFDLKDLSLSASGAKSCNPVGFF
jgi:hypothetical protein